MVPIELIDFRPSNSVLLGRGRRDSVSAGDLCSVRVRVVRAESMISLRS